MIRWTLIVFLVFQVNHIFAQNIRPDQAPQENKKTIILSRVINFVQPKGTLENALLKLAKEQHLKFSYSNDKIQNIFVAAKIYSSQNLSFILSSLLESTGYTYSMISDVIVIVQSDKTVAQEKPKVEKPVTVTPKVKVVPKDTSISDTVFVSSIVKDTIPTVAEKTRKINFYFLAGLGLVNYFPALKHMHDDNWIKQTRFDLRTENAIRFRIGAGIKLNHFIFETGISFQKLNVHGIGKGIIPDENSGIPDTVPFELLGTYQITSIPVKAIYYLQHEHLFIGAGPKVEAQFISKSNTRNNSLKEYYEDVNNGQYSESDNNFSVAGGIVLTGGIQFNEKSTLSCNLEYNHSFSPYYKNSLFSFSPNALIMDVSFIYFLRAKEIRNTTLAK